MGFNLAFNGLISYHSCASEHYRLADDNHQLANYQTIMKFTETLEEKRAVCDIHVLIESNNLSMLVCH